MGGKHLAAPVVGITAVRSADASGAIGYRLVAQDGGIFDFGTAIYYGSGFVGLAPPAPRPTVK